MMWWDGPDLTSSIVTLTQVTTMILSLAMLVLYTSGIQGTAVAELNTDNVYEGLLKADNIAIHVLQNTVNYVASSVAWGILTHFYQVRKVHESDNSVVIDTKHNIFFILTLNLPYKLSCYSQTPEFSSQEDNVE